MLQRILVPYDFSEPSGRALQFAAEIARLAKNSQLCVLHIVVDVPTRIGMEIALGENSNNSSELAEFTDDMMAQLRKSVGKVLKDSGGLDLKYEVVVGGDPVERILQAIGKDKIDLVVMGSAGHKGLGKLMGIGSVSRNVMEKSAKPVTIVH
ncbi:universal stress protein [Nitrososphaera sp.]|uniref:universal stress protein n=1 Tax=Nitrososphaera sp. TaxID=1971748 RepID=UPI00307EB445